MKLGNSILWGGREIEGRPIPPAVRVDLALFTARSATAAALLLAVVLPTVAEIFDHGRLPAYDPELAVLTATLIAIIWTAYHTFQLAHQARLQSASDLRRLKQTGMALRSGLIAELEDFGPAILRRAELSGPDDPIVFPREQLARALAHPELFSPPEMAVLATLDYLLRFHLSANQLMAKALKKSRRDHRTPETDEDKGEANAFEEHARGLVSKSRQKLSKIVEISLNVLKKGEYFSLQDHVKQELASEPANRPKS